MSEKKSDDIPNYKIVTIRKRTLKGWVNYKVKKYINVDYDKLKNTPGGRNYMTKISAHIRSADIKRKKIMLDFIRYIRLLSDNDVDHFEYGVTNYQDGPLF